MYDNNYQFTYLKKILEYSRYKIVKFNFHFTIITVDF